MTDQGEFAQKRLSFDPTINLGHILTTVGLLFTLLVGGYGVMQTLGTVDLRLGIVEKQIVTISRLLESSIRMETEIDSLERRMSVLESKNTR